MKSLRIVISGASGRMGQEVIRHALEDSAFTITAALSRASSAAFSMGAEVQASLKWKAHLHDLDPSETDLVVDFSSPVLLADLADWAQAHKKPIVSGTTDLTAADLAKLEEASATIPILWSPNMSPGIAFLTQVVRRLGELENFDFQIEEIHHKHKKDKPSGTARLLQRELKMGAPHLEVPEPISIRGGEVFGEHKVFAMSPDEVLTFQHIALNRGVFARGALIAAKWLANQGPGLYSMKSIYAPGGAER